MRIENLDSKTPEGFNAYGLPVDKSAPPERVGARIGLNLTIMVDSPINQNSAYPSVIIWNTETGERIRVFLDSLATKAPTLVSVAPLKRDPVSGDHPYGHSVPMQTTDGSGFVFRG